MKIAFWSEQRKVGTTFNMAVVACASVLMYPLSAAVVSGGYQGGDLEKSFRGKHRRKKPCLENQKTYDFSENYYMVAEQQEYFLRSGLDCLLCKERSEDLTEQVIKANMRQVMKDRMYYLPGSHKEEQEWWRDDRKFVRISRVMNAVEDCFDVMFIDCGSRKDDFAQKLLHEADVCVLNMDQREELIGDYYRNMPSLRGKTFFLVGNYFKDGLYTRKNLERLYRVEEDLLGAIPYNPQMQAASRMGKTDGGVKKYIDQGMKGENVEFEKELMRTARLILKRAGLL